MAGAVQFRLRTLFFGVLLAAGLAFAWRLGAAAGVMATIGLCSAAGAVSVCRGELRPTRGGRPDLTMFLGGALGGAIAAVALVWAAGILTALDAAPPKQWPGILCGCGMLSIFVAIYGAAVGGVIGALLSRVGGSFLARGGAFGPRGGRHGL